MSYTTQEIAAAVEKLVRTSIRRGQGTLGNRETGVTFNDYQDAAAGTFLLYQNAPFYAVYLAAQNLKRTLQLQREVIGEFIAVVEATDRRVTPISNLSPLANARVALDGMLLASASRTKTFNTIEEVPAWQRFDSNTQQFLDESSKNIREDGEIVRTPGEARGLLAGYYRTLQAAHADVIRRVELLEGAINDFNSLDLPASLISAILENARDSVQSWYTTLQELSEKDRLKLIRDATLDILAARSTVTGFGSLTGATMFVPLEGDGQVYSDDLHPATPAEVSSTLLGPYIILEESPILHFELEGDSTAIEVQGSFVAALDGTVYGPYSMGHPNADAAGSFNNNELTVQILNRSYWGQTEGYKVGFPETATSFEAWEVAGIINNAIYDPSGEVPMLCEPYANPLKFGGGCDITWDGGNGWWEFESINTSTDFGALDIKERDYILIAPQSPVSSHRNAVYQVRLGGVGTTQLFCDLVHYPTALPVDELAVDVRITGDELPLRLRLTGANDYASKWDLVSWDLDAKPDVRETALAERWGIGVPQETSSSPARVVGDVDLTTLTLPADVVTDVMTFYVDGGGAQSVDLTGFAGTTPASLAAELDTQMTGVTVTVTADDFIRFKSDTSGEYSEIRLTAGNLLDDLFTGGAAGAPYEGTGSSGSEMQLRSATSLGFYPGSEVLCIRTTAEVIADNVTESPAAALTKEARVEAEAFFSATHYSGRGRTDPFNALQVVVSLFEQDGMVATNPSLFTYEFPTTGAASAGVQVGHIIAIRGSVDDSDIGKHAVITSVDDTQITATFTSALADLTDVDVEVGPDLTVPTQLAHNATVVLSGTPASDGAYGVLDTGSVPFELELGAPLPFPAAPANLPIYFDLEVGYYGVTFKSLDTTLATAITVNDNGGDPLSAADRFFSSLPAEAVGSTAYFQLPEWHSSLNEGDTLELYPTQFDSPSVVSALVGLEESSLLVELDTALPTDTPVYTFGVDVPVPLARMRNNRMNTYTTFQESLETWLLLPANQEAYFRELLRLLNPLAVNTNPTADQVGDARTQLELLDTALVSLDGYIDTYEANVVPQVDVLLSSLQEKGADRARDILLEAQFSTFFGLSMDETSYSGSVQAKLKEISREDLPVRKDNRVGDYAGKDELLGQYEEPDYEYDLSDLDEAEELDIPAGSTF